jgi:hypothetical protein
MALNAIVLAQVPQSFKYQAVIRNGNGDIIASKTVGLRISIIKDNILWVNSYIEIDTAQTNQFGLVNLNRSSRPPPDRMTSIDSNFGNELTLSKNFKIEINLGHAGGAGGIAPTLLAESRLSREVE